MFVTFISIHLVIVCVIFFDAHMRRTRVYPFNPGVTIYLPSTVNLNQTRDKLFGTTIRMKSFLSNLCTIF
jgi:hypothetical protein